MTHYVKKSKTGILYIPSLPTEFHCSRLLVPNIQIKAKQEHIFSYVTLRIYLHILLVLNSR